MAKKKQGWKNAEEVEIPPGLVRAIQNHRCIVFIGAGISQASGLPGWKQLLSGMIAWCKDEKIRLSGIVALKKSLKKNELLEVAEELKNQLGTEHLRRYLSKVFHDPAIKPSVLQEILAQIQFAGRITTNYDKLHEMAYLGKRKTSLATMTHRQAAELSAALREGTDFLVKAHGDIDQSDTIVLTASDYQNLIHCNKKYHVFFQSLFSTKTVLFVGCSLTDPDFQLFLGELKSTFQGHTETHYALLPEQQYSALKLKRLEEEYGICPLAYLATNGHPEVLYFLEKLRQETKPQNIFLTHLSSIQEQFQNSDYHYRIGTDGTISVSPKDIEAYQQNPEQVLINARFDLNTTEGRAMLEEWERHLDTGKGITLPNRHFTIKHLPDFGLPIDSSEMSWEWIKLEPIASNEVSPMKLEVENPNGDVFMLPWLELRIVQRGRKEITLANKMQPHRFQLTLVFQVEKRTVEFGWSYSVEGLNVLEALEAERFFQAWSQGGKVRVVDLKTGLVAVESDFASGGCEASSPLWVSLLTDLAFIQTKVATIFSCPYQGISQDEVQLIRSLKHILKTGRLRQPPKPVVGTSTKKKMRAVLSEFSPQTSLRVRIEPQEMLSCELFGQRIEVGPVVVNQDVLITPKERSRLEKILNNRTIKDNDPIEFQLEPLEGGLHEALFTKWLSPAERQG